MALHTFANIIYLFIIIIIIIIIIYYYYYYSCLFYKQVVIRTVIGTRLLVDETADCAAPPADCRRRLAVGIVGAWDGWVGGLTRIPIPYV